MIAMTWQWRTNQRKHRKKFRDKAAAEGATSANQAGVAAPAADLRGSGGALELIFLTGFQYSFIISCNINEGCAIAGTPGKNTCDTSFNLAGLAPIAFAQCNLPWGISMQDLGCVTESVNNVVGNAEKCCNW